MLPIARSQKFLMMFSLGLATALPVYCQDSNGWGNDWNGGNGSSAPSGPSTSTSAPTLGTDAVDFELIPITINANCSWVVFKAGGKKDSIAYVMPRATMSLNKDLEDVYEIIPLESEPGAYVLRFAIYLAPNDSSLSLRQNNNAYFSNRCDINDYLKNWNAEHSERKISRISAVLPPINHLRVSVQGLEQKVFVGGSESGSLDYNGHDLFVEFKLKNKSELNDMLNRIHGTVGLPITVEMAVSGRNSNGSLKMNIDFSQVATKLRADVEAKFGTIKGVKLPSAELKGKLGAIILSMNSDVTMEESQNPAFNDMLNTIVKEAVTNFADSTSPRPRSTSSGSLWGGNSDDPAHNGFDDSVLNEEPNRFAPTDPNNPDPAGAGAPAAPVAKLVNVSAFAAALYKKNSVTINIANKGTRHVQYHTQNFILRTELRDPTSKIFQFPAGSTKTLWKNLTAGSTFDFIPVRSRIDHVNYTLKDKLLGLDELLVERQKVEFKGLGFNRKSADKITTNFTRQSQEVAVFHQSGWTRYGIMGYYNKNLSKSFVWGRIDLDGVPSKGEGSDIDPTLEAFGKLPLQFQFTKVGAKWFSPLDLTKSNDLWESSFSVNGKLELTAKQNLGYMIVRNTEKPTLKRIRVGGYFQSEVKDISARELFSDQNQIDQIRRHFMGERPTEIKVIEINVNWETKDQPAVKDNQTQGPISPSVNTKPKDPGPQATPADSSDWGT